MLPGEYRVKAPGALVRAGIEQSSARVTELATDAALAVEEVKLNGRGVARARVSRPVEGWLSCKCVVGGEMLAAAAPPAPAPPPPPKAPAPAPRPRPPPEARAAPPAPVATEVSSDAGVVSIGGVSLSVARDFDAALVPAPPPLRGCGFEFSREAAATLQWMLRKAALRQDMFLLGDAGPRCRQLALAFCELARREAEFVSLTRDSNESDLKQRRELRGGDLAWADQPPVAAAKRGRVLILEGVEKAERNVLPLLNNLLENREMALEDGTFLTPRANAGDARLARVHDDFLVVAIGRPAARYARRKDDDAVAPLDPPLRSRFVSRRVGGLVPSEDAACLAALGVDDGPTRDALARFCAGARALSDASAAEDGAVAAPRFPEGGGLSVGALLVAFPGAPFYGFAGRAFPAAALALDKAAEKALRDLGGAVEAARARAAGAARRDYALVGASKTSRRACRLVFRAGADEVVLETACGPGAVAAAAAAAAADAGAAADDDGVDALSVKELKRRLDAAGARYADCREKAELRARLRSASGAAPAAGDARTAGAGPAAPATCPDLPLTPSQRVAVTAVVQDLACCRGVGACVVGERGCGKSAILRAACAALGYGPGRARYVFCHRELSARELLQRRGAEQGRTSWRDGAVVAAAIRGDVAVLDGVHRLAPGVLAGSLGRLICDGEAQLPDGRRLVRADDWDRLAAAFSAEELKAKGLVKVRRGFRVVAAAEPPPCFDAAALAGRPKGPAAKRGSGWLTDEVLGLFHFHVVAAVAGDEARTLLEAAAPRHGGSDAGRRACGAVVRFGELLARADDEHLRGLRVSARQLARLGKRLDAAATLDGAAAKRAIDGAFAARLRFAPRDARAAADGLADRALREHGLRGAGAAAAAPRPARAAGPSQKELEDAAIHVSRRRGALPRSARDASPPRRRGRRPCTATRAAPPTPARAWTGPSRTGGAAAPRTRATSAARPAPRASGSCAPRAPRNPGAATPRPSSAAPCA